MLFNLIPNLVQTNQECISPQFVTPKLLQEKYYSLAPYTTLWENAENILMHCNRLVTIGFDFPKSDSNFKQLLTEVKKRGAIQEIIVVNSEKRVAKDLKKIFPKEKIVQYKNLKEYLASFRNQREIEKLM
jgi:hypothetical protein